MNWQRLWLGFLLPLTVSCRAVGPGEKEAAVVSLLGKPDPGWGGGMEELLLSPIQAALLTYNCLPCPSLL